MQLAPRKFSFRNDCRALALLTMLLFLVLFRPWDGSGYDDVFYYSYLSSTFFDGDMDVANDYALSNAPLSVMPGALLTVGPKGLALNQFAVGSGLLWLPLFALVRGFGVVSQWIGVSGGQWADDRFALPYRMAVSLGSLACGFLALILIYASCRMMFRRGPSLLAALAVVFASPLLHYMFVGGGMSHAPSAFAVSLMVYLSLRCRKFQDTGCYVLVGAASALVVLVRWQDIVLLAFPLAIWLSRMVGQRGRISFRREAYGVAAAVAVSLALLGLQMCYWKATLGSFITMPQGSGFMRWTDPLVLKTLFSGYHGLFYCHPLLLVGAVGLGVLAVGRSWRMLGLLLLGLFSLSVYINACAADWFAGASFGARRFSSVLPMLAFGVAAVVSRLNRRWIPGAFLVTGGAVFLNVLLSVAAYRRLLDAYFFSDLWLMGREVLKAAPDFLLGVPLNGFIGMTWILDSRPLMAMAVAAAGCGLIALLCLLMVRGRFPRDPRWVRGAGAVVGGLALIVGLLMLWRAPQTDTGGLRLAAFKQEIRSTFGPEFFKLSEELIGSGYGNPGVHLVSVMHRKEADEVGRSLEALKGFSPHFWGRCVTELPVAGVTDEERASAGMGIRKHAPDALRLCNSKIFEARRAGNRPEEIRWLEMALMVNPFDRNHIERMAQLKLDDGLKKDADKLLRRRFAYSRARVKAFTEFRSALAGWDRIYFHGSGLADLADELAGAQAEKGEWQEAVWTYGVILSVYPDRNIARLKRAAAEVETGGPVTDAAWMSKYSESPTISAEGLMEMGRIHLARKDRAAAVQTFVKGLERYPADARILFNLNQTLAVSGIPVAVLDRLSALETDVGAFWIALGGAWLREGQFVQAERDLNRGIKAGAAEGYGYFLLAQAVGAQKRGDEALEHFRKAYALQPEFAPIGRFLAEALEKSGNLQEARQVLSDAISRHPADSAFMALCRRHGVQIPK